MTNTYTTARRRLAVLYTIVFGSVILIFSGVVYKLFADDIHEDMVSVYQNDQIDVEIINRHKTPLRNVVIALDGGLLVFIAVASYFLAGMALKPIQQVNEAEKRFIANASHELRTPIAILKTDMEVYLLDKDFPKQFRAVFLGYLEEVNNMKYIVENMLTLFRFESKQVKLNREDFSLSQMVKQNIKRIGSYAQSHKVTIKTIIPKKVIINGDKFFIQQAYRNILKNAIEYSNKDGVVTVKVSEDRGKALIAIKDQGIGIPKMVLAKIFDRFQRSSLSAKKRGEGVGLGLAIAKSIVEAHRGRINITSAENEGTEVEVYLPSKK